MTHYCSVVSDWPHGPQHARPPCPSPTPGVYSNTCPLSRWCHPTVSSSVVPFSSLLQSFPASGSFQMRNTEDCFSPSVQIPLLSPETTHPTDSLTFPLRGHRNSKEKLPLKHPSFYLMPSLLLFLGAIPCPTTTKRCVRREIRWQIWQFSILISLKSINKSRWLLTQILSLVLNAPCHNPVQPPQLVISHPF